MRTVSPRAIPIPAIDPDEVRRAPEAEAAPKQKPQPQPKSQPRPKPMAGAPRAAAPKGPGPSKLGYRLARAWAKPIVRNTALVYLPLVLLGVVGWRIAAHDGLRTRIEGAVIGAFDHVASRAEFAVTGVEIKGASPALEARLRDTLMVAPGMSSLKLDVADLRQRAEALGAVARAKVHFDPKGTLRVTVVERLPVALTRHSDGTLALLDAGGVETGLATARAAYPELPLVLGEGGAERIDEVLSLIAAAPEMLPRLRAFVRVGERRWNVELDRGLVIKLPAEDPLDALSRVMALHYGEELLDRDLAVIDMRVPDRPSLRMTPEAAEAYQIRKAIAALGGEET